MYQGADVIVGLAFKEHIRDLGYFRTGKTAKLLPYVINER